MGRGLHLILHRGCDSPWSHRGPSSLGLLPCVFLNHLNRTKFLILFTIKQLLMLIFHSCSNPNIIRIEIIGLSFGLRLQLK